MDPAEAPGGKEADPGGGGELHGGADGGGPVRLAMEDEAEVGGVDFGHIRGSEQLGELRVGEADGGDAVDDADDGGFGAGGRDDGADGRRTGREVEDGGVG